MVNRLLIVLVGLLGAAVIAPVAPSAQNTAAQPWPDPVPNRAPVAEEDKRPAPRRDLSGLWGSREGTQSKGVQLRPKDGSPYTELPYTPYGWELFQSHRPMEGTESVPPDQTNDTRVLCEPLGMPRQNHYDLGVRIYQDEYSVAILYQYDSRWRVIWTDGRTLPTLLDGGVDVDGQYWEPRWSGYSVGRWIDDYTLEVQTVGTMPEDRVWLDNVGRPISDQVRVTETFRRLDHDTLEWSETIEDPKVYTEPWQTMKLAMTLLDPRTDVLMRYCSPVEIEEYNRMLGYSPDGR